MNVRWSCGWFLVGLLVATPAAADDDTTPCVATVDDHHLRRAFARGLSEDDAEGRTVSLAELRKQLVAAGPTASGLRLASPTAKRLPGTEVYAGARRGVVAVGRLFQCDKCSRWHISAASGFAVTPTAVVTNYHVVARAKGKTLGVLTADHETRPVTAVIAADARADLALLRVERGGLRPLAIGQEPPVGSRVFVLSHPVGQYFTFTDGMVSRYAKLHQHEPRDPEDGEHSASTPNGLVRRMAITAGFARGSSGAPVLDEYGAVVGVVASTKTLYYDSHGGRDAHPQMVLKRCVPAAALLRMLRSKEADVGSTPAAAPAESREPQVESSTR